MTLTSEEREALLAEVEFVGNPANLSKLSPVCCCSSLAHCLYPRLLQERCIRRDARSLPRRIDQAKRLVAAAGLARPARRFRFNEGGAYRVRIRYDYICKRAHCEPYVPTQYYHDHYDAETQFPRDDFAALAEAYALKPLRKTFTRRKNK